MQVPAGWHLQRECQVYCYGKPVYKQKQFEVDFVATKGIERYYIQSAYAIPDEAKEKQEKHSLLKIDDSFRKLIIVHDDIKLRRDEYDSSLLLRDYSADGLGISHQVFHRSSDALQLGIVHQYLFPASLRV